MQPTFENPETDGRRTLLLDLYRRMLVIREVEEQLEILFRNGAIPGFIHLGIGQEAVAVGVCAALGAHDTVASTHRGHGHALAKGVSPLGLIQEILGKAEGVCGGRGGSLHVADFSVGMLGANGIVGGGIPIALGSALAHKTLHKRDVAAVFFGDGAQSEGVLYEAMNLASLWSLPLLFVCENNGWSEFSPVESQFRGNLEGLAASFGVEYRSADGGDAIAIHSAASHFVDRLRRGDGPGVLECRMTRVGGHYAGDAQRYRANWNDQAGVDPLDRIREHLRVLGEHDIQLADVSAEVSLRISDDVAVALTGSEPNFDAAYSDVYSGADTS
jgi:TPP-dependent pyruvate/acetoin dehydrogenase alpha subunit